jgi:hypothetical protein
VTPAEIVLGGIVISLGSAAVGKYLGSNGKVTTKDCGEHRSSCSALIIEKINNLIEKVDRIEKIVNNKTLGI